DGLQLDAHRRNKPARRRRLPLRRVGNAALRPAQHRTRRPTRDGRSASQKAIPDGGRMTEFMTDSQILEQRITDALVTIRREWPHMMPRSASGSRPGGGAKSAQITADDDADTGIDSDRTNRPVALPRAG